MSAEFLQQMVKFSPGTDKIRVLNVYILRPALTSNFSLVEPNTLN